ncbi:protein AMN1 homolog [Toxorhynchites rutilus septentrionalis]|uniref:protein AMN1 homolog n=1 Tax=Toxorhynchites rutilus septentrionalis TaxID=329112 RepID=UPI0024791373|nr:protein AMN1 homolog [Toxorhynchites rutilus septentrionalis]
MNVSDGTDKLKKQPSSLYDTCIRYVARNLKLFKDTGYLQSIPPVVKNTLIVNVTRVQGGFHDDDLLDMLLNRAVTRINLSTSTITDRTLLSLAEKCPNLRSLTLSQGEYRFTRIGLDAVARSLPKLEQISIKKCAQVNDEFVSRLAYNCPNLDLVDLDSCFNVTDISADAIKYLKLTKLNLSRTRISDEFLRTIADDQCALSLEDLNVGHCRITAAGLGKLPWHTIKYIGFEGCEINDLGFIGMNKNLQYVQWTISK